MSTVIADAVSCMHVKVDILMVIRNEYSISSCSYSHVCEGGRFKVD